MRISVFGSCPTSLNDSQEQIRQVILGEMELAGLEWRSVDRTDYPTQTPLKEVLMLAKHCSGGIIFGFSQFSTEAGIWKDGTPFEKPQAGPLAIPTAWNQLEAGILYAMRLPLLVFKDEHISGGIFDYGVCDAFIQEMPTADLDTTRRAALREIMQKFAARVHHRYYEEPL